MNDSVDRELTDVSLDDSQLEEDGEKEKERERGREKGKKGGGRVKSMTSQSPFFCPSKADRSRASSRHYYYHSHHYQCIR